MSQTGIRQGPLGPGDYVYELDTLSIEIGGRALGPMIAETYYPRPFQRRKVITDRFRLWVRWE